MKNLFLTSKPETWSKSLSALVVFRVQWTWDANRRSMGCASTLRPIEMTYNVSHIIIYLATYLKANNIPNYQCLSTWELKSTSLPNAVDLWSNIIGWNHLLHTRAGTSPTFWTHGLAFLGLAGTRGFASPIEDLRRLDSDSGVQAGPESPN